MRIHVNLSPKHVNSFQTLLIATALDGKGEWPSYANEPNFMAPGVRRCDYVMGQIRDRKIHMGMIYK